MKWKNSEKVLEIRKNTFSRNYENSFFREFSKRLFNSFKDKNLSGLLIGSPLCEEDERLQIDALLLTRHVVCIVDFKNYSGKIKLPPARDFELGLWSTDTGETIKGGSSINPFIQLKNQKRRFVDIYHKYIHDQLGELNIFDPQHIIRIVCFQQNVEVIGKIPPHEGLNFFILDKANFVEGILDIIDVTDKDVCLSEKSYDAFKNIFRANPYKFEDKTIDDVLEDITKKSVKLDYNSLYDDQKEALSEIKTFLESDDQNIFVLKGTLNSGKSYIIPFIQDIAYNIGIQETEIFALSGRVSKNLISLSGLENVHSIYSYIYGGLKTRANEISENIEDINIEEEPQTIPDELPLEIVPIKKSDNAENAVFIVDESQLITDAYHQSIDLVFGTGCLLKDFLSFTELKNSNRKIIFIGDPYQLNLGKANESSLSPTYLLEKYNFSVSSFKLNDKESFSDINNQALRCVRGIDKQLFNSLQLNKSDQISFLAETECYPHIQDLVKNNKDAHILTFSNEDALKVNYWIKKSILKNGEDLAGKDLIAFHNNINVEDESIPFSEPKKIYNGQFAIVESVADKPYLEKSLSNKDGITTLTFREIIVNILEFNQNIKILSIENYRLSPKGELSKDEIILFKILFDTELRKEIRKNPFDKSQEYQMLFHDSVFKDHFTLQNEFISQLIKGTSRKKDLSDEENHLRNLIKKAKKNYKGRIENDLRKNPSSEYYKLKNAALLRFGWAMTVHRSMSYKWHEVVFNVEPGEDFGKTNENHFRWIYTGLSRARQKVALINYKPISPFSKTEFRDNNTGDRPEEILFHSDNPNLTTRLDELREFIKGKLLNVYAAIINIEHFNWQERYTLKNNLTNKTATFTISYNAHGIFKTLNLVSTDTNLSTEILNALKNKTQLNSYSFIKDEWRKDLYEKLSLKLIESTVFIGMILQSNFKDKIRLFSNDNELEIEIDYKAEGLISFITAKYYSNESIWKDFQNAIDHLINCTNDAI